MASVDITQYWGAAPEFGFRYLGDTPAVFHCHHFNLFLDQTIEDALGAHDATRLRMMASRDASYQLLSDIGNQQGLETPEERMDMARGLFAAMGHGTLSFQTSAFGGIAQGNPLHYGYSWCEKYGQKLQRMHPTDPVAAGFAAAATAYAFKLPVNTVTATETQCVSLKSDQCQFVISGGQDTASSLTVDRIDTLDRLKPIEDALYEDEINALADGLREFTSGTLNDERGLIQGFGVIIASHMSNYYNRISYGALDHINQTNPALRPILIELLRECGHVCVFQTFGGILVSPEWESLAGPLSGEPRDTLVACCAIARGLGFGQWSIGEYVPNERLVHRAPATYESAYYRTLYDPTDHGTCFTFHGAAQAIMRMMYDVPWLDKPELSPEFYASLFKGKIPWKAEETRCLGMGDDCDEMVVVRA